jgi:hypothetical protein
LRQEIEGWVSIVPPFPRRIQLSVSNQNFLTHAGEAFRYAMLSPSRAGHV